MTLQRRTLLAATAATLSALPALPVLASSRRALAPMTDGPFYPPRTWRERGPLPVDWDADLTRVTQRAAPARGEHLALLATVVDTQGRLIDNAEVEIWQCDTRQRYRHPGVALEPGSFDEGFQGFGAAKSRSDGTVALRTIKPVPYPGRTPHIHVKLRHASFGELTSQLFLAGDAGNERDFLWRQLSVEQRTGLAMQLRPAGSEAGLRWTAEHALVVPA
jgi:protocatechuate 3,4-dioxygenase, beta subunit